MDLHNQVIDQGDGYWVKIEAWTVSISPDIPHGIRYSLTLHEPYGDRILGYDNAHAIRLPKKFKYAGVRLPYDHRHLYKNDQGVPYAKNQCNKGSVRFLRAYFGVVVFCILGSPGSFSDPSH